MKRVKKLLMVFVLLFAAGGLFAWHVLPGSVLLGESEWSMGVETRLSAVSIKEYVLADNMNYILSRLDWELDNILTAGVSFSYQLTPSLVLSIGVNVGGALSTGTMDDYDWAKESSPDVLSLDGIWSHYSHHDNNLKYMVTADVNLFYHTGTTTRFYAGGGFLYKGISMDGVDGYYQHTDVSDPNTTPDMITATTISGDAISYAHHSFIPYLGVGLRQEIGSRLYFSGFTLVTPLAWAVGLDRHWGPNVGEYTDYTDYLEWDLYLFFSLKAGFLINKNISVNLGWEMVYQPRAEGNTEIEKWGESSYVVADTGGGSFMSHSFLFQLCFRL